MDIKDFAIGNHELLVVAIDEAGNQQETRVEFEVVSATTPQPSNRFIATLPGLTAGEHTLRLNAVDEAGNGLIEDMVIIFQVKVMASGKGN
jgi:hypothetical protein